MTADEVEQTIAGHLCGDQPAIQQGSIASQGRLHTTERGHDLHALHRKQAVEARRGCDEGPGGHSDCRGFPQLDAQIGSIAVFATNTTTKKLQQAQRQTQPAQAASNGQ